MEPRVIEGLVSTVIPVHNRPDLLREAVASVMAQTHRAIEIIIVDDGSTDQTPNVCEALRFGAPDAIRVVRTPRGGPGAAREAGRLQVQGEFVQYLDSDDLILPRKFELQVEVLRQQPGLGACYCKTREYVLGLGPTDKLFGRTGEFIETLFPLVLSGRWWHTASPLFRRWVVDTVGPWRSLLQEEDWEYDARIGALGIRVGWCAEPLADYRHHSSNRASGGSLVNNDRMRSRVEAHRLIYQHARRAGIGPESPHMQRYARELFLLARQCGVVRLREEALMLFDLAREASGPTRARGLDFRLYRLAAGVLGWVNAGRIACWTDRLRSSH